MSFLTPLYIAGLLAASLPLLFHLIRRTPQGETTFSSLMFLEASPPRITRRSRLEHLVLLALRGLALTLLALAFARPFFREAAQATDNEPARRRVAIVVDTSASMRRENLWEQAVRSVDEAVAACRPQDEVGVFAFDETLRTVAGFEDLGQVEPGRRRAVIAARMATFKPSWAATRLGQALLDAVAVLDDSRDASADVGRAGRRIVLVSDMQSGGKLQAVGDYPWPTEVDLVLKPITAAKHGNAGLERLADGEVISAAADRLQPGLRIRISNASDSSVEQFRLQWKDANGRTHGPAVDAYVPPGESRVVRTTQLPAGIDVPRLVLAGDAHEFDNALYIAPKKRDEISIVFLGTDQADDPRGLRYYLERALESNAERDAQVAAVPPGGDIDFEPAGAPTLAIVASEPSDAQILALQRYTSGGGTIIYVVLPGSESMGLAKLMGVSPFKIEEAAVNGYTMLGEIDFSHPLFVNMAGPKFNDFTQIRFWKYRRLDLPRTEGLNALARFENGDPAMMERRLGRGRLLIMTTGWGPDDSQLARSWKFLLMLSSLVDEGRSAKSLAVDSRVNGRIRLPEREFWGTSAAVTRPDGSKMPLAEDVRYFIGADAPGIYTLDLIDGPAQFAVNLDPAESDTAPLTAEEFEQVGCRLAGKADVVREAERLEQLRDVELESRQKLWQWLIVATLGVLIVETWLAGRLSRSAASLSNPASSASTPWAPT